MSWYRRSPEQAPRRSSEPGPVNPGPSPEPPKLEFRGSSWQWYYRRRWKSLKLPKKKLAEAKRRFALIKAKIEAGEEIRERPGGMLFKTMIERRLKHLETTAVTATQLNYLGQTRSDAVWWLQFFGNKKLRQYRAKDSSLYQAWYVEQRKDFYLAHPLSRRQAANGAVASLRALKRFCREFAEDEETEWNPTIKIPDGVPVPPGRILERSEQARLLKACMGGVWDHETNGWKTKTFVDGDGVERVTWRVRNKRLIAQRKGYSRVIRAGVRTAVREEVYAEVVWGRHAKLAHFEVDESGAGDFRRRGTRVPDNNKSRPPSSVADRLKVLLRIWMYEDGITHRMIGSGENRRKNFRGKKHKHVFRKIDGTPYATIDLAGIVADAGLGPDVTEHALRFTAVDEAHQQKLTLEEACKTVGMSQEMLLSHYTDWARRNNANTDETLMAANSAGAARLLRAPRAKAEAGDRKRKYARRAERIAAANAKLRPA